MFTLHFTIVTGIMITELTIKNFRSIKGRTVNLGQLNFLVGPNNAGKSNIMRALNLCLGDSYPTARTFNEKDFFNYDKTQPIFIQVKFDSTLSCNPNVYGFRLTFNGLNNDCEYLAIDSNEDILCYQPSGREVRVSNEMKEEVALMYLGLDRQATQQIRPSQWTLYGKLLKHIERQLDKSKKQSFATDVQTTYESNISQDLQQLEDILRTHVKQQTGLDLFLRLSMLDPMETIKNLRPYVKEPNLSIEFDAEDIGAGAQSALAVAIAQAYSQIVRKSLVMAIEEPELYMHPHGCRHFYRILKQLASNDIQVICTTHERCFVNVADFESIHLVRKTSGDTTISSGIDQQISSREELELSSKFDEGINEVFFANHVILVEGPVDKIACRLSLENLGLNLDQRCVSIIECGSNSAIKPIAELLSSFDIAACVLVDQDPGNQSTAQIIYDLRSILGADKVFLQSPKLEGLFGLSTKPSKIEALDFFPSWLTNNLPPNVYVNLKNHIEPPVHAS
jgi:putative ATP-dependent endonuclease of OLD family